jgi:signal transduction histidine kinase
LLIAVFAVRQLFTVGFTFSNLTFKYRIQLVFVIIILASLGLFGIGSILFIRDQYQNKNEEIISDKTHSVRLEIEYYLKEKNYALNPAFANYLLNDISAVFGTDVNMYDLKGDLYASSRQKLFDEGLISRKMNPEAFLELNTKGASEFIHDEHIGNLEYLSAYLPVRNKDGQLEAYLNFPYFARQSALEKEISQFLVALINIYVLLFALSVLAAIFVSNYLTHPLRLIQDKMRQVKLGKINDPIRWQNNDEIGSLVFEYNRMITELAQSAERLAQSERESAWREMAKQVAHEIKNPLTPMRLSIQLFERAYKDKAPGIDEKIERMSKTMIEQIDTLASIANAFSDFAKMPKVISERMDVLQLAQSTVGLFRETSEGIDINFNAGNLTEAIISADKEQLVRVFNNLLKNAVQAIPEDRNGKITVTLERQTTDTGARILLAFADNGTGIADEVIDKIFVPNFTTKTAGMGLGLAMVKNITEHCGGRIWFETTKGKGTTFFVSFPEWRE